MELNLENIIQVLKKTVHPVSNQNLVDLGMISDIEISHKTITLKLIFQRNTNQPIEQIKNQSIELLKKEFGSDIEIEIKTSFGQAETKDKQTIDLTKDIKNIIAVASGKGGVGKSTIAANLAVAMAQTGAAVGLLDADIYGPSVPKMFELENQRPEIIRTGNLDVILPIKKYGVHLQSIGFFVNPSDALVWRGPMATSAIKQLITQTDWGKLDYLFIDMPPGTGDVHLTLVQTLAVTGVIIVSTPQQVALADVVKGIQMFTGNQIKVPVLGLVENMSWFTPVELPENKYYIFGREGCKQLADKLKLPLLGQIPLVQSICENSDIGRPPALSTDSVSGQLFRQLALNVAAITNERNKNLPPTQKVIVH